jgi:N-formylglutamate deformylase
MIEAPFIVLAPTGEEIPIIVEIPHAGLLVPPHISPELLASARARGKDADLYVDELYAEAPALGASVLRAQNSRYVVDLNRAESDIDPQSVVGAPDGHSPRGVIWRVTSEGDRALAAPLRREAFERRLAELYRPYHTKLAELIREKKVRFGLAVVLAAHSMPSSDRRPEGGPFLGGGATRGDQRADVVPGTLGRTSAHPRFIDLVDAHARQVGFSVMHDDPYRGGFTTQHYGRPAANVHVVQVELARRLYMDELSLQQRQGPFERLRSWCGELVANLGRAALT